MRLQLEFVDLVLRPSHDDGRLRAFRPGERSRIRRIEAVLIVSDGRITLRFNSLDDLAANVSRVQGEILAILGAAEGGGA